MGDAETWLIVYAPRDDSFSLISETEAVFDKEHLEVEDKITFIYDSEEWEGVVKGIGGNDDYENLKIRMKKLNSERKKTEVSFHRDRPRKVRSKNGTSAPNNAASSKSATVPPKPNLVKPEAKTAKSTKESPLSQILNSVPSSSSSDSDSDLEPSPPSSPIPESIPGANKKEATSVKRKSKEQDITTLKKLKSISKETNEKREAHTGSSEKPLRRESIKGAGSSVDINEDSKETNEKREAHTGSSEKPLRRESIKGAGSSVDIYEDSDEGKEDQKEDKKEKKIKKKRKHGKDEKEEKKKEETEEKKEESKGESDETGKKESVLRWKEGDEDVVLVQGRSKELADKKFYISTKDLTFAKSKDNATTFAKSLLVAAFTDRALYTHSVSGGQYRAGGKANITQRPALPADVIAVIADVALHRQAVKKWNPNQTKKEIINQLRQKLVDLRPRLKKELGIE